MERKEKTANPVFYTIAFPRFPVAYILLMMRYEGGFPVKTLRELKNNEKIQTPETERSLRKSPKANSPAVNALRIIHAQSPY
jgi:hypothetical protein